MSIRNGVGCFIALCLAACAGPDAVDETAARPQEVLLEAGKADEGSSRSYEVLLNDPHCDVCTAADKNFLKANSAISRRVIELINGAQTSLDVGQFTFSVKPIGAALTEAHERGVKVRLVLDKGQDQPGRLGRSLKDKGLDVRFVAGKAAAHEGGHSGLQHAKFMLVDGHTVATGSNNWSSTGTSFNEESTIIIRTDPADALLQGFQCHFNAMWNDQIGSASACSSGSVRFSPGSGPRKMIRDDIRAANESIDVLMHHFTFGSLVKELRKAAERGVRVRLVVNAADRHEYQGGQWPGFFAAGGQIRFKRTNTDLYQIMHHKLAIIDGQILINGSGNWSGSGFFNNYENYVRYTHPKVIAPFLHTFERLWGWSLTAASLDGGVTAAQQHTAGTHIFFGNLHAHVSAHTAGGHTLDDGKGYKTTPEGDKLPSAASSDPYRYAFEYARDVGGLDFIALTPHTADEQADADGPNMSAGGFNELSSAAAAITAESSGAFLALPGYEWSTNSSGNHVNVFGANALAKVERGRFDLLYGEFLPERAAAGDVVYLQLNHPKTFRLDDTSLKGSWDQIFDVTLTDIPKKSERKKKFNDYGLDDFAPLASVLPDWIAGNSAPDPALVAEGMRRLAQVSAPYARLMEVTLSRGNELSSEVPTNPSLVAGTEEGTLVRRTKVHSDFDYYLAHGFRLAPAANHDNHFENWGTGHTTRTAVIGTALTEAELLASIGRRAVYATEAAGLRLRYYAGDRVPMGGVHRTLKSQVELQVWVEDGQSPGPFEVRVWQGRVGGQGAEQVLHVTDLAPGLWRKLNVRFDIPGEYFTYLEVAHPAADAMAWSAPIWVERLGSCGDGWCGSYEACGACSSDCGECEPACGDGSCHSGEACDTCPADCGACEPKCDPCDVCGDGTCGESEDCESCAVDCGECVTCGDGTCSEGESCADCAEDCGACVVCGDGTCAQGEDCETCDADCGACISCGDGACNGTEACDSCPQDCGACISCGDGTCNGDETCATCEGDCGKCAQCGDASCDAGETCESCPGDCGACVVCGDGACTDSESCEACAQDCGTCGGNCCDEQSSAGCDTPAVQACVCAKDPYCCSTQWDWLCRDQVTSLGCGACN